MAESGEWTAYTNRVNSVDTKYINRKEMLALTGSERADEHERT